MHTYNTTSLSDNHPHRSSSKLSLSTSNSGGQGDSPSSARSAQFSSKRLGGDSSSHGGRSNPFNSIPSQSGLQSGLASPTTGNASSAFGLGSGAFASFGSAKTPKSPGNPFEAALGGGGGASAKTPSAEKSAKDGGLGGKAAAIGKPASNASLAESAKTNTASSIVSAPATSHPLRNSWVFWFRPPISKANGFIEYEKTLHPIATCDTVEEFFAVYERLRRSSALPLVSDYHLFKKGIRPIWEDDENKHGGKWIVRLRKGVADRYWEDLLFAIIGDQFYEAGDEICGAVLSVRNGEDILSIWARADGQRVLKIRETMRRTLAFPPDTKLEWKSHDSSIQQRTAIEESRREKANSHHQGGGGGGNANGDKRGSNNNTNKLDLDQKRSLKT
ncbi:translation initiation factor eIF 4e-like domain-containing protein [Bombardia bombarda]|uniref:Translation initiation factor eIF 4e-like domain-containing protein n=1 Tax=Bombardia bombarda TaxID=252184 RepID=A0AA40BW76_9PEZI|nr:translation initiation factor eIF 4e-like domain-containing protein [Bombardia bombarda]